MSPRLVRFFERAGPVLAAIALATLCLVNTIAGFVGLYLLLTGAAGMMQAGLLYFLTGFAVVWSAVWLFLLFSVVEQAVRRR